MCPLCQNVVGNVNASHTHTHDATEGLCNLISGSRSTWWDLFVSAMIVRLSFHKSYIIIVEIIAILFIAESLFTVTISSMIVFQRRSSIRNHNHYRSCSRSFSSYFVIEVTVIINCISSLLHHHILVILIYNYCYIF